MNRLRLIGLLFFFSGAAGLMYEQLWVRLLSRHFGHTVYAVTTVLATFMGGLALGSALFGARADRSRNPLRLYGLLELGIGVSCLVAPLVLELTRTVYIRLYPSLGDSLILRTLLQFVLSALVLLIPATLMGGTLPAALRTVTRESGRAGSDLALLYGSNTAGAALGALATGYLLLPSLGVLSTNYVAVATNLLIGALVLTRFRDQDSAHATSPTTSAPSIPEPRSRSQSKRAAARASREAKTRGAAPPEILRSQGTATHANEATLQRLLKLSLFLSGALAMGYQLAWTRSLILVIGSSTYAFSAILVTFLIGMAAGSYLFRFVPNAGTPRFFALLQVGVGLSALLLIPLFDLLPALFTKLFAGYDGGYAYILVSQFLLVAPFILLPSLCLGMVFPCALGILSRESASIGADSGRLYAFNTLGAITGTVLTGFVCLPQLGSQLTLAIGIACNLLLGAAVLWSSPEPRRRLALGVAALVAIPLILPRWDPVRMSLGASIYPRDFAGASAPFDVLLLREGVGSTVTVATTPSGGKSLRVNGKVDASTEPVDMLTQARLAYIPLLLHPEPRKVAIVGLGSGVTAGIAARFQTVQSIDVVELEPAVVEAAQHFAARNYGVLDDRKVAIHIDDARSFLELREGGYDVLISEPSNPWIAGVAALFSSEFMMLAERKLAPGGLFCQWLQTYSISPTEMKLIMRTFADAFPDASVWRTSAADYVLIGRKSGSAKVSASELERRLAAVPELQGLISALGELPVESFWTSFRVGAEGLLAYAGEGPLNTEDMLPLEFSAPRSLYLNHSSDIDDALFRHKREVFPTFVRTSPTEHAYAALQLGQYLLLQRREPRAASWYLERAPALVRQDNPAATDGSASAVARLHEDFEGPPKLQRAPRLVAVSARPGEDVDALTAAHELLFGKISGVAAEVGVNGSQGLQLHSLPGVKAVGFTFRQAVEPSTRYRVSWSMRIGELGGGSVAVLAEQLASADPARSRSLAVDNMALISEPEPWTPHQAELETTPDTRLLQIYFSYAGEPTAQPVLFDDLVIEKL